MRIRRMEEAPARITFRLPAAERARSEALAAGRVLSDYIREALAEKNAREEQEAHRADTR